MISVDLLLASGAGYKKVNAGETIFNEGQNCLFYYQLVNGQVRAVNIDDEGKECIQAIVDPGESFGELPLFDDAPYALTAIANKDSLLIRLCKPTFLQLMKEKSELNFSFMRMFAKRLRFKNLLIQAFGSHCPEKRIAAVINYQKAENKSFCASCYRLNLTRQQIADMTGLRVETVIRTMRAMHEKGVLVISKGKVYCRGVVEDLI